MRVQDGPPPGWYPDPEGGLRLRWWEGADWADRWRAPPTPGVSDIKAQYAAEHGFVDDGEGQYIFSSDQSVPPSQRGAMPGVSRADSQAIINEVRMAARQEAERAAATFGREARSAAGSIGPLISEYTNRFMRWVRVLSTIAVILLIAWLAFQIFAQASLFEWIGDRIDNLTDNDEPVEGMLTALPWRGSA